MTSTDKTGDKLVDSIRRTKAGTGQAAKSGSTAAAPEKSAETQAKSTPKTGNAPASKTTARKAPVRKTAARKRSGSGNEEAPKFTFGRRVWPD